MSKRARPTPDGYRIPRRGGTRGGIFAKAKGPKESAPASLELERRGDGAMPGTRSTTKHYAAAVGARWAHNGAFKVERRQERKRIAAAFLLLQGRRMNVKDWRRLQREAKARKLQLDDVLALVQVR